MLDSRKNLFYLLIAASMVGGFTSTGYADSSSDNLLLKTNVSYSGVEGGLVDGNWVYPDFVGEKAVDGDMNTRWSADKKDEQWLVSDMGTVKHVKEIVLPFHAEAPSYDVLTSKDGIDYELVFSTDNGSQGNKVTKKIQFEEKEVRYIKYHQRAQWVHTNGKKYGSSLYEMEAYAEHQVVEENPLFKQLLQNRRNFLTGEKDSDGTVLDIIANKDIELRNSQNNGIWDTMIKNNKAVLWEDKSDWKTNSANLKLITDNIQKMAIQYQTENSIFYQDKELREDILYALDWYYTQAYNEKITNRYGNWFHWEVSIPKNLVNIYLLMKDEVDETVMANYVQTIDRFIPNPAKRLNGVTEAGANLLDKCFAVLGRSIIDQNNERYETAITSSLSAYDYIKSGDGFYADGSFIQHNNVPYTGGYGAEVLGRVGDMLAMFAGTDGLNAYPAIFKIFDLIELTYKPTLIDGQSMSLTRGRRPSRSATDDFTEGRDMLFYIATISMLNPQEEQKNDMLWFVKSQVNSSETGNEFYNNWDINKIQLIRQLIRDNEIPETTYHYDTNRNMGTMSQMFHRKKDFSSAISMFSKTTTAFEYINKENKQGFYTGTGMHYLYNGDKRQYLDGYWGTVDMLRLPGTTTDGRIGKLTDNGSWLNTKGWSGGISNGHIGSASIHYTMEKVTNSSLEAKKSWFMLDDRIVATGAGIKSNETGQVETIIENRKVTNYPNAKLYVDGIEIPFGTTKEFTDPKWAYLDTGEIDSSIGYLFSENSGTIKAEYKLETKNWQVVNETNPSQQISNRFMILSVQHGEQPQGANYQYTVFPSVTLAELKEEFEENTVTVLANTTEQQVIELDNNGTFIGNF